MPILTVKTLLSRTHYQLGDDAIEIAHRTLLNRSKVIVPLDSIQYRSQFTSVSSKTLFWVAVVLVAITIAMIANLFFGSEPDLGGVFFYGSLTLVFGGFFVASRKSFEIYPGFPNNLYFNHNAKREPAIQSFMEDVLKAKRGAIKKRALLRIDATDRTEAFDYLKALHNNAIISDQEFLDLKSEIEGKADSMRHIGFTQST